MSIGDRSAFIDAEERLKRAQLFGNMGQVGSTNAQPDGYAAKTVQNYTTLGNGMHPGTYGSNRPGGMNYTPQGSGNGFGNGFGWNPGTLGLGFDALNTFGNLYGLQVAKKQGNAMIGLGRDQLAFDRNAHSQNLQLGVDAQNLTIEQINQQKAMQRNFINKTHDPAKIDEEALAGYQDIAKLQVPNNGRPGGGR
tara:strand:- start:675 stop:1256 length:582 start_codon:yes stop_codon:yes gene_type:complete